MPNDAALIQYMIIVVADIMGAFLMGWWMLALHKVGKKISIFYIILFILFVGGVFHHTLNAYSRFLFCTEYYEEARCLRASMCWTIRLVPDTIAKVTVVAVMLHRCIFLRGKK